MFSVAFVLQGASRPVGLAADFERTNGEYLSIAHSVQSGLAVTGSLTLVGWMKPESLGSSQALATKHEEVGNNRAYALALSPGDDLRFLVSPDGRYLSGYLLEATPSPALSTGTWYHVAGVYDSQAQSLTLYLDGDPIGTKSVSYGQVYLSTAAFMLGASQYNGGSAAYFDGLLDEWRVYDQALSEGEIEALMSGSAPPVAGFTAAPLSGLAPLTVTFTNTTTGEVAGYEWAFGDGATSVITHPTHIYTTTGVYSVSLTATGPGGSDTLTRTSYITVTEAAGPGELVTTTVAYAYDPLYRLPRPTTPAR